MFPNKILRIHSTDNIVVALRNLSKGDIVELDGGSFALVSDAKAKHKFAIRKIAIDEEVYMYGVIVGKANNKIHKGEVITRQNIIHETEPYVVPKNWTSPNLTPFNGHCWWRFDAKTSRNDN